MFPIPPVLASNATGGWIFRRRHAKAFSHVAADPRPGHDFVRSSRRAGVDIAPWDFDFRPIYAGVRERLLRVANGLEGQHWRCRCQAAAISSPRPRSVASSHLADGCSSHAPVATPIDDPAGARVRSRSAADDDRRNGRDRAGRGRRGAGARHTPSPMSVWSSPRPPAASCTTSTRSARWSGGPGGA